MSSNARGGLDLSRLMIGALLIGLLVVTLSWLQGRFDDSDHRKATELVTQYRPREGGLSIAQALRARHPGLEPDAITWSSEITSGCLGHVRVYALVRQPSGKPSETYAFDVDLAGPSVHPTDPKTIAILQSLTATTTRTATTSP